MKLVLIAVVLLAVVVNDAQGCRSDKDCKPNECCTMFFVYGRCKPFLKEGDTCKDVFKTFCPCGKGLKCVPKEPRDLGEIIKTCIADPKTTAKVTSTTESVPTELVTEE